MLDVKINDRYYFPCFPLARTTILSLRLLEALPEHPILTVNRAVQLLGCSRPAAGKTLRVLEEAGILRVRYTRKKNRTVVFEAYLDVLREGTELV